MHVTHLAQGWRLDHGGAPASAARHAGLARWSNGRVAVEDNRLVVGQAPAAYTLEELLAQCDPSAEPTQEDREWLDGNWSG